MPLTQDITGWFSSQHEWLITENAFRVRGTGGEDIHRGLPDELARYHPQLFEHLYNQQSYLGQSRQGKWLYGWDVAALYYTLVDGLIAVQAKGHLLLDNQLVETTFVYQYCEITRLTRVIKDEQLYIEVHGNRIEMSQDALPGSTTPVMTSRSYGTCKVHKASFDTQFPDWEKRQQIVQELGLREEDTMRYVLTATKAGTLPLPDIEF